MLHALDSDDAPILQAYNGRFKRVHHCDAGSLSWHVNLDLCSNDYGVIEQSRDRWMNADCVYSRVECTPVPQPESTTFPGRRENWSPGDDLFKMRAALLCFIRALLLSSRDLR